MSDFEKNVGDALHYSKQLQLK